MVLKASVLLLFGLSISSVLYAQSVLRLTDSVHQSVQDIHEGDRFMGRYQLPNQYERFMRGRLMTITDSTIVYRTSYTQARHTIPLMAIRAITRTSLSKHILPIAVGGVLAAGLNVALNRRNVPLTTGLLTGGAVVAIGFYTDYDDRRRLARNRIGDTISLSVIPAVD